jgi:hypothetical protein
MRLHSRPPAGAAFVTGGSLCKRARGSGCESTPEFEYEPLAVLRDVLG